MEFVPAYWMNLSNLGDAIAPFIIEKLTNKKVYLTNWHEEVAKYMITGSILNHEVRNAIVWGCGVARETDLIPRGKDIYAVRGVLTGEMCKRQGIPFQEVYGDPALILPKFIQPTQEFEKTKIGVLPHYVDQYTAISKYSEWGNDVVMLDILGDLQTFVDQINQCKIVYSSTLHGIIFCHAYGIPCYWVKFSDMVLGDDMKFYDHYTALYVPVADVNFLDLRGMGYINYKNLPTSPLIPNQDTISYVVDKLINNFPKI